MSEELIEMAEGKNTVEKIKNHFLRTGTFLLYTLVFNVVSFILYFIPAFFTHTFNGIVWLPFGILQVIFTVLFFKNTPLPKVSYDKGTKSDLLLYFLIISALSILVAFYRFETDSWFTYIFFNTFHPLTSSKLLDSIGPYIFVCVAENTIKTFCLYQNTLNKSKMSAKVLSRVSVALIVLYFAYAVVLFILFTGRFI